MIYIQNFSDKLGSWRREPRLVTYATKISLLRSLVASQQKLQNARLHRMYLQYNSKLGCLFMMEVQANHRSPKSVETRHNVLGRASENT